MHGITGVLQYEGHKPDRSTQNFNLCPQQIHTMIKTRMSDEVCLAVRVNAQQNFWPPTT